MFATNTRRCLTFFLLVLSLLVLFLVLLDKRATDQIRQLHAYVTSFRASTSLGHLPRPFLNATPNDTTAAMLFSHAWRYLQHGVNNTANPKLTSLGFEPTDLHEFKSPYIITPKIYSHPDAGEGRKEEGSSRKVKTVSCFNCPQWFKNHPLNRQNANFEACPYPHCKLDLSGQQKATADMVIFFVGQLGNRKPPPRAMGQIWVMAFWESPVHYSYPSGYSEWRSVFNWTFTYRTDSDIFAPGNRLAWRDRSQLLSPADYLDIAKKKTRTAAWWVSNCSPYSKRLDYARELQKHIDVDIYGACGPLKCSKHQQQHCSQMLNTTYKFYLGFENSFCQDYVTEKLFRNFENRAHIIPVVRGGLDYDRYLPPNVLVNTAHFKTPALLAAHLKQLGSDPERYASMLREKDKLVALGWKFDWCDVCEKLHTDTQTKNIPDIKQWSHEHTCYTPTDV